MVCSRRGYLFIFFFKQKTAYEMRISDWSSDVCSSDLATRLIRNAVPPPGIGTPGFSTAPVTTRSLPASHRHRCLDRRQRVVAFDGDVVVAETEDVAHVGVQLQRRQRTRRARQLLARLFVVVDRKSTRLNSSH